MQIQKIKKLFPNAVKGLLDILITELSKETWSDENKIHFLTQCVHESSQFRFIKENLNYSAEGLRRVFPKYFFSRDPIMYAYKPEKIANVVYANRMGNGDEKSGDGWKYRGRGIIQLTGKENYAQCMLALGVEDPDYFETPEGAVKSAIWFWKSRYLTKETNIITITKRVNGGTNGLEERKALYKKIRNTLLNLI